jgi:hypothetical protein
MTGHNISSSRCQCIWYAFCCCILQGDDEEGCDLSHKGECELRLGTPGRIERVSDHVECVYFIDAVNVKQPVPADHEREREKI